jgi:hypothetical protein
VAFVGSKGNAGPGLPGGDAGTPTDDPSTIGPDGSVLPADFAPYLGQSTKRTRVLIAGAATLALGGACLYTFLVDPNSSSAYPQCPLKAFTNIDCPGCGGLRATHALLHGDIIGAADHNVLALILLPIMAFMFARWVLTQFDLTVPKIRWPRPFVWITPLVLVAFTVGRNLPVAGLSWLNSGWG